MMAARQGRKRTRGNETLVENSTHLTDSIGGNEEPMPKREVGCLRYLGALGFILVGP